MFYTRDKFIDLCINKFTNNEEITSVGFGYFDKEKKKNITGRIEFPREWLADKDSLVTYLKSILPDIDSIYYNGYTKPVVPANYNRFIDEIVNTRSYIRRLWDGFLDFLYPKKKFVRLQDSEHIALTNVDLDKVREKYITGVLG